MPVIYQHEYEPVSVYGNVVELLRGLSPPRGGVHVDVGCGYGAISAPLRDELGLHYVGFDLAEDGLVSLRERGFEAYRVDLSDIAGTEAAIATALAGRQLASLTFMDTLEHVTNGRDVIGMLRRLSGTSGAPLVLSVPNVTHKDIVLKLLAGRWDTTEAGLLDYTHVEFYNAARLNTLMASCGWSEVALRDWRLEQSDQFFPSDLAILDHRTPAGSFLRNLIDQANPDAIVNQFVRAFRPVAPASLPSFSDRTDIERPFLSVVLDGSNGPAELEALLKDLAVQEETDFEVLATVATSVGDPADRRWEGVRIVAGGPDDGPALNLALQQATGRYVAILSAQDRIAPNWAAALKSLAPEASGTVLLLGALPAPDPAPALQQVGLWPLHELVRSDASIANAALPGGAIRHLGLRARSELGRFAPRALLAEAILLCGAASSNIVAVSRSGLADAAGEAAEVYGRLALVNGGPLLLPQGAAERIYQLALDGRATQSQRVLLDNAGLMRAAIEAAALTVVTDAPAPRSPDAPFLTIVTRTRGDRLPTLKDTLMSLAGQSCEDFELLLVIHNADDATTSAVEDVIADFPKSIRSRISTLRCNRPGRAAPLNDALARARGAYVCVLDDDDFVFGNYVETFRELASQRPGAVLRTKCARQDYESVTDGTGSLQPRMTKWFAMDWPDFYDPVAHLHTNFTPFMSVAFPVAALRSLGLSFDESLTTAEDWDLTTRAAMLCGVHGAAEVTAVYRWWTNGTSSAFSQTPAEWVDNRLRVLGKLDARPVLLPAGTASQISTLLETIHRLNHEVRYNLEASQLVQALKGLQGRLGPYLITSGLLAEWPQGPEHLAAILRGHLDALTKSSSWRLTRPLRSIMGLLRGRRFSEPVWDKNLAIEDSADAIARVVGSASWKVTTPLRAGRTLARRLARRTSAL